MLDAKAERAIGQVARQVREAFGTDLVSLVLYGSAAGPDYVPERSDLNVAIVLSRVTFAHLRSLQRLLPGWHALGAAAPLLIDRAFLARARDVFPMELFDIQGQHRVLFGEEVFATLKIDGDNLRYQAEYEARSKLLRLRTLFAEVGGAARGLTELMQDSAKTFALVMKAVLRLRGCVAPVRYLDAVAAFESAFGVTFPTLRHVLEVKLAVASWRGPLGESIEAYLGEVEQLVEFVDRVVAPET